MFLPMFLSLYLFLFSKLILLSSLSNAYPFLALTNQHIYLTTGHLLVAAAEWLCLLLPLPTITPFFLYLPLSLPASLPLPALLPAM